MFLSVRELLQAEGFKDAEVISGHSGLDNKYYFFTPLDTLDIADWLYGYELVYTNGYVIREETPERRTLMKTFHEKKVAALLIKKGRFLDDIPQYMIEDSNRYGLPIIRLPYEISWDAFVGSPGYALHGYNSRIIDLAMSGSLAGICQELGKIVHCPVAILDAEFQVLAKTEDFEEAFIRPDDGSLRPELIPYRYNCPVERFRTHNQYLQRNGLRAEIIGLEYRGKRYGYIVDVVYSAIYDLSDCDIMTLSLSSMVVIWSLINKENRRNIQLHNINDFWLSLLEERDLQTTEIQAEAETLGMRLAESYAVGIWNTLPETSQPLAKIPFLLETREVVNKLQAKLNSLVFSLPRGSHSERVFVAVRGYDIIFFIPNAEADLFNHILSCLYKEVAELYPSAQNKLYVGDCYTLNQLFKSYKEAIGLAEYCRYFKENIVCCGNRGILRIFFDRDQRLDIDVIRNLHKRTIVPLMENDKATHSTLIETLEAFLDNNMSVLKTAEALHLHKNSLRYRLEKIENITGLSFDNVSDIVDFYCGVQIMRFVEI